MALHRFIAQFFKSRAYEDLLHNAEAFLRVSRRGRLLTDGGVVTKSSSSVVALNSADPNGIKTSFATSTSAVTLRSEDYDGAEVSGGELEVPRDVTITLASNAGSYNTDPIKISGVDAQGEAVQETVTPSGTDGGETLTSAHLYLGKVQVEIPGQQDTNGAFEIGVGTAVAINPPCDVLFVATAGTMVVGLTDDFGHTITLGTTENLSTLPYSVKSVHSITDAAGIRPVYFG